MTAGCAGFFGGEDPATPVTPVADVEPPAPGVPAPDQSGSAGVSVDTTRLQAANRRVRANSTYVLRRTVVVRGPSETMRIERTRVEGAGETALEHLTVEGNGRLSSVVENGTLWTNGTTAWTRTRLSNGRVVTNRLLESSPGPYGFGAELSGHVLSAATFDVRERADGAGAILQSRRPFSLNLPLLPLSTGPATNATGRLVVDSDGFVSVLDLSYETTFSDRNLTVSISHRLDREPASVSRPAWVPVAER
jgi:hypothetical protein